MKEMRNKIIFGIIGLFAATMFITSCEEADLDKDWGLAKIYMPQASLDVNGNADGYPVPLDGDPMHQNYVLDTLAKTINVHLGVYCSAMGNKSPFSVDVITRSDTVNQLIAGEVIKGAVHLPEDVYNLPTNITVPAGQQGVEFNLEIDLQKLIDNYPELGGAKLVLAVALDNPSNYELNNELSTTVIVIDAREFMPAPPIENLVAGGAMETDDEQLWMWADDLEGEWGFTGDLPNGGAGGCLKWTNQAANITIYSEFQVEAGQEYKLSALCKIPEGTFKTWFDFFISDINPEESGDWGGDANSFAGMWIGGEGTPTLDGNIIDIASRGRGNSTGSNGVFTATGSTMYIIIKAGAPNGSYGTGILIDEVVVAKY